MSVWRGTLFNFRATDVRPRAALMASGTLLICLVTHYASSKKSVSTLETFRFADSRTESDVDDAMATVVASHRAIIFLHVDWAVIEPQRSRFIEFMREYQRTHVVDSIQFHYVDITPSHSYAPIRSIAGWKQLEDAAGQSLIHGWGELAWLQDRLS